MYHAEGPSPIISFPNLLTGNILARSQEVNTCKYRTIFLLYITPTFSLAHGILTCTKIQLFSFYT